MSLLDHYRPPRTTTHPWEGFHSTWATLIAGQLNERLPPDYVAIPLTSREPMWLQYINIVCIVTY
jgi:hypothetical protein